MAAVAARAAMITPAPDLALAGMPTHELMARQTNYDDLGLGSCMNIDVYANCNNGAANCYSNVDLSNVDAINACNCNYGIDMLDCVFNGLPQTCQASFGIDNWQQTKIQYLDMLCGSVPAAAMARMTPPSIVSVSFTSVRSTRLSRQSTPTPRTSPPNFTGVGKLISGRCSSTSYTLVDAGSTVYWAGFVGCMNDRPECCPWSAARNTAAEGGINTENRMGVAYPSPADGGQLIQQKCADDYYSVSGSCCPNGYFPYTSQVGGATPCWSSMNRITTAPTLTANVLGQPTDTGKPTSAVVNLVWAVQYPVQASSSSSGLSTGAIAGIAVGGLAALALVVAVIVVWIRYRRKNNALKEGAPAAGAAAAGAGGGGVVSPESDKIVVSNVLPVEAQPNMPPQFGSPPPSQMQPNGGFAAAPGFAPPPGVQFVPQQPMQQQPMQMQPGQMYPQYAVGAGGVPVPGWGAPSTGPPSTFATHTPPPPGMWPSPPPPSSQSGDPAMAGGHTYSNSVVSGAGNGGPGSEISSLSGQAPLVHQQGAPGQQVLVPHYSGHSPSPQPQQMYPAPIPEGHEGAAYGYGVPPLPQVQQRMGTPGQHPPPQQQPAAGYPQYQ